MGKNLTTNQKTEIAKSTLTTRMLITINLDSGPFRILVNDSVANLNISGNVYYSRLCRINPIQTSLDGNSESVDLIISDIAQEFSGLIANNGDVLTNRSCKIEEIILGKSGNVVDSPVLMFDGLINNLEMTQYYCSFSIERLLYSYSTVSPNMTYDVNCQFKFKDSRCQYAGTETKCDKTLARCQALSNVTRFGGYPSVVNRTT